MEKDTSKDERESTVLARNVSMYPDQWDFVDSVNEWFDYRNVSLALRHIINDYRRLTTALAGQVQNPR